MYCLTVSSLPMVHGRLYTGYGQYGQCEENLPPMPERRSHIPLGNRPREDHGEDQAGRQGDEVTFPASYPGAYSSEHEER